MEGSNMKYLGATYVRASSYCNLLETFIQMLHT